MMFVERNARNLGETSRHWRRRLDLLRILCEHFEILPPRPPNGTAGRQIEGPGRLAPKFGSGRQHLEVAERAEMPFPGLGILGA